MDLSRTHHAKPTSFPSSTGTGLVNSKGALGMIHVDFRKAFDTVMHDSLVSKLGRCGLDEITSRWVSP